MSPLYINAWQSISALGSTVQEITESYRDRKSYLQPNAAGHISSFLSEDLETAVRAIQTSDKRFSKLDRSVLLGMYCAQKIKEIIALDNPMVNIGSSRGATHIWEQQHAHFLSENECKTDASPSTTLGNISSWVGQIIGGDGAHFSHSITCSSAHHAILNAAAWLQSGMSTQAVVGGSEAPLSNFGIGQMKALGIYAKASQDDFPVKAFALDKKEGAMALGEAACLFALSTSPQNALIKISGLGWGTERIKHGSSITSDAQAMQKAMRMATNELKTVPDAIVTHSPGTYKGDKAENEAIEALFGAGMPCTNNKWKIGHSFGASAAMSIEMAMLMLINQEYYPMPYVDNACVPKKIGKVLINSVGFGGNAVSILMEKV